MKQPTPKAVTILKALLMGMRIKIGARTYLMDADYRLCSPGYNVGTGEEVLLAVDFGGVYLQNFIALCESATEDEMIAIGANLALNMLKQEQL